MKGQSTHWRLLELLSTKTMAFQVWCTCLVKPKGPKGQPDLVVIISGNVNISSFPEKVLLGKATSLESA